MYETKITHVRYRWIINGHSEKINYTLNDSNALDTHHGTFKLRWSSLLTHQSIKYSYVPMGYFSGVPLKHSTSTALWKTLGFGGTSSACLGKVNLEHFGDSGVRECHATISLVNYFEQFFMYLMMLHSYHHSLELEARVFSTGGSGVTHTCTHPILVWIVALFESLQSPWSQGGRGPWYGAVAEEKKLMRYHKDGGVWWYDVDPPHLSPHAC